MVSCLSLLLQRSGQYEFHSAAGSVYQSMQGLQHRNGFYEPLCQTWSQKLGADGHLRILTTLRHPVTTECGIERKDVGVGRMTEEAIRPAPRNACGHQ